MAEKLYQYEGFLGVLHGWRDGFGEKWREWKDRNPHGVVGWMKSVVQGRKEEAGRGVVYEDYSHLYRRKTRSELIRVSAAVMGIEFSYAAETAFVTPTLLKIGVDHQHMTMVWALSPLLGFFLTPILGSLSDRCSLNLGRRRPFIIGMSIGIIIGLLLIPNGELLGYSFGDSVPNNASGRIVVAAHRTSVGETDGNFTYEEDPGGSYHPMGVFFTILGTVLVDFNADACQSPARAYLLDVSILEDHARGLSTFTIMAGLGGFLGYAMCGTNWDVTFIGKFLGGHVRTVFILVTVIFFVCVYCTVTSFKEMPLRLLEMKSQMQEEEAELKEENIDEAPLYKYGSINLENEVPQEAISKQRNSIVPPANASFLMYLKSIIHMPKSLRMLCITNLFSWMSHVCYSLYFTDFVGEAVFGGNPQAPVDDPTRELYEAGVRFGSWGMSMYSLSCACYSVIIEKLINKFGAKKVYIGGFIIDGTGMLLMALVRNKIGVIIFSWAAGIMYSTLFTIPYLLIAHYHATGIFGLTPDGKAETGGQIRGLGTDVAVVSSMVFMAQFVLSMCMGSIVTLSGTTTAVVVVASSLAFVSAVAATQVLYVDL